MTKKYRKSGRRSEERLAWKREKASWIGHRPDILSRFRIVRYYRMRDHAAAFDDALNIAISWESWCLAGSIIRTTDISSDPRRIARGSQLWWSLFRGTISQGYHSHQIETGIRLTLCPPTLPRTLDGPSRRISALPCSSVSCEISWGIEDPMIRDKEDYGYRGFERRTIIKDTRNSIEEAIGNLWECKSKFKLNFKLKFPYEYRDKHWRMFIKIFLSTDFSRWTNEGGTNSLRILELTVFELTISFVNPFLGF